MKNSNKIIENFVYNQKRRAYSGALSSEKYRIYNHPTEEDRKLYHSIRFTYKKHTRIKQKRCVEAKLYMEPNIKDVNIYNKLIDECMYSTENNDSDYESGDERIKLKINESSDEDEIEFKNHRFSQNNLKTNVLETTVKEKKRGKIQKIFKNLNETNKAIWQPIFLLKLDEIIILKNMINTQNEINQNIEQNLLKRKHGEENETNLENSDQSNKRLNPTALEQSSAKMSNNQVMETNTEDEENKRKLEKAEQREVQKKNRQIRNHNMYKKTQARNDRKPNTIVYSMNESQMQVIRNVNVEKMVVMQTGAQIRDSAIKGNRLFIYPRTQSDFEGIFGCTSWEFSKNECFSLENRDYMVIISFLGIEDVEYNNTIKTELKSMGIVKWDPLIEDDREFLAIKATCRSKEDCKSILKNYYLNGKTFKTINGRSIQAKIGPNVPNPKQCFNCFKFTDHYASECTDSAPTCEKCGKNGHKKADCTSKEPTCLHCNGCHDARDRDCKVYKAKKKTLISDVLIDITGSAMDKPSNNTDRRAEARARQKEGIFVAESFNVWQVQAEKRVEYAERNIHNVEEKVDEYFQKVKIDVEKNSSTLVEAVKLAQNTHSQINDHMLKVSTEVTLKLEKKMANEVNKLTNGLDTLDNNVKMVYNELKSWRDSAERNDAIVDNRLQNIENYLTKNGNLIGDDFTVKKLVEINVINQITQVNSNSISTTHSMQGFINSK